MKPGRDSWWHDEMRCASEVCEPEWLDAEDPLFILYTRYIGGDNCRVGLVMVS